MDHGGFRRGADSFVVVGSHVVVEERILLVPYRLIMRSRFELGLSRNVRIGICYGEIL